MNTLTIPSTDARFPTALRAVAKTPKMLYARGNLAPLHKTVVAIVGTRTPSPHALALTEQATLALGKAGFVIVTGGARGVDSRALQTALAHGFPVVCVVGNGFEQPYPPENEPLFEEVACAGLLLSEKPVHEKVTRFSLLDRNHITSGISNAVVVIASKETGGSMHQAKVAHAQGRPVFAPTGELGVEPSSGPQSLIHDGIANPFSSVNQLVTLASKTIKSSSAQSKFTQVA